MLRVCIRRRRTGATTDFRSSHGDRASRCGGRDRRTWTRQADQASAEDSLLPTNGERYLCWSNTRRSVPARLIRQGAGAEFPGPHRTGRAVGHAPLLPHHRRGVGTFDNDAAVGCSQSCGQDGQMVGADIVDPALRPGHAAGVLGCADGADHRQCQMPAAGVVSAFRVLVSTIPTVWRVGSQRVPSLR